MTFWQWALPIGLAVYFAVPLTVHVIRRHKQRMAGMVTMVDAVATEDIESGQPVTLSENDDGELEATPVMPRSET